MHCARSCRTPGGSCHCAVISAGGWRIDYFQPRKAFSLLVGNGVTIYLVAFQILRDLGLSE